MDSRESCAVWPTETSCFILALCFFPFSSAVPLLLAGPLIPGKSHQWEAGRSVYKMKVLGGFYFCESY